MTDLTLTEKAMKLLNELPVQWDVLVRQYQAKEMMSMSTYIVVIIPCALYLVWFIKRRHKLFGSFSKGDLEPKYVSMVVLAVISFMVGIINLGEIFASARNVLTPDVSLIQSIFAK